MTESTSFPVTLVTCNEPAGSFPVTLVTCNEPAGRKSTQAYRLTPSLVNEAGKVIDFIFDGSGCRIQQDGKLTKGPHLGVLVGTSRWEDLTITLITDSKGSKLYFKRNRWERQEMSLNGKYTPNRPNVINAKTVVVMAALVALAAGLYFGLRSIPQAPTGR